MSEKAYNCTVREFFNGHVSANPTYRVYQNYDKITCRAGKYVSKKTLWPWYPNLTPPL